MRFEEVGDGVTRLDGALGDWQGVRFVPVGEDDDARFEFAFRYDADGFYVGARVWDERLVRNRRASPRDDALVVTLALPRRGRLSAIDVWFFPGVEGRLAGAVAKGAHRRRPRSLRGARVVEGPLAAGTGYVLEGYVPWSALGRLRRGWQSGRVSVRLHDVDSEARPRAESEPSLSPVNPRALQTLPEIQATGGEASMLRRFLASRSIEGTRPWFDVRRNVAGDRRPERVVIVDRFVVVMGPGYRGGTEFDFFELPVVTRADAERPSLTDLTGDGKAELAVRVRQRNELGSRTVWQVYGFTDGGVSPRFGIEVRKETDRGFVEADVRLGRGRPRSIVVEPGRAEGLDASNFAETRAAGVEGILLPWANVSRRSYRWDGERFAVVEEIRRREPRSARMRRPESTRASAAAPSAGGNLLAEYRRRAGISPDVRSRHGLTANLAEGGEPEQLAVFDSTLVVVGPGFRRGQSAFEFAVPVESPSDLLRVSARDLTGDGRAEVLLTLRRHLGDIARELLLVYQFTPGSFRRIGAVEVARAQGPKEVRNDVRVTRNGLEIRPGRARGWDSSTWPWADGGTDDIDALLLPWRDQAVRYAYDGGSLSRRRPTR